MNGLQSGSPAGKLAPQSYSNTTQDSSIQETIGSSSIQQTPKLNSSLNTLPATSRLQVSGMTPGTLGVSTDSSVTTSQANSSNTSSVFITVGLSIAVLSFCLAIVFLQKYRKLKPVSEKE